MKKPKAVRNNQRAANAERKQEYVKETKFENLDLIQSLNAIVNINTKYYQSDFEIDKRIIQKAMESTTDTDKTLLWLSRTHGTLCFRERDALLKYSHAYHTWLYYMEHKHENVLAYVTEVTGSYHGKPAGNLYHLNYKMHCQHIMETAIPVDHVKVFYEHGNRIVPASQRILPYDDHEFGKFKGMEEQPKVQETLCSLLQEEKNRRHQAGLGDFQEHLSILCRFLNG